MKMITIVADENIPFLKGVLEPYCDMVYLPGTKIRREHLLHADGLIVRTRTQCGRELLEGTGIRFIATATIGFDHIDAEFCQSHGIEWHHAAGCNAGGVQHYMAAALTHLAIQHGLSLSDQTLGVIGVGHVGSRAVKLAGTLGMKVLQNDPPRARQEGKKEFVTLGEVLEGSTIITLHVPLNLTGPDKTLRLADQEFFNALERKPFLVNTSRGGMVDGEILKKKLREKALSGCVLDVWDGEPDLDRELMGLVDIATPHIAGYSTEGQANGAAMCVQQASRFFGFGLDDWHPGNLPPPGDPQIIIDPAGKPLETILHEAIRASYDILEDDRRLRQNPHNFEKLRNEYPVRREFPAFHVKLLKPHKLAEATLRELGFVLNV
jgi:erythronate-4-phosphate dehydrogenase